MVRGNGLNCALGGGAGVASDCTKDGFVVSGGCSCYYSPTGCESIAPYVSINSSPNISNGLENIPPYMNVAMKVLPVKSRLSRT